MRTGIARPDVVEPAARISDGPFAGSVPTLSFGDWDAIAATVVRLAGLDRRDTTGSAPRRTSRPVPVLAGTTESGARNPS